MQDDNIKMEELSKLNKEQRVAMKNLWNGRGIERIYVDVMPWNTVVVKVCSPKGIWLIAELGPKGGIKSKDFQRI